MGFSHKMNILGQVSADPLTLVKAISLFLSLLATAATFAEASGGDSRQFTLSIEPRRALVDEPVTIMISGLQPGERVSLKANLFNHGNADWKSAATYIANAEGVVDLNEQAPVEGSYSGIDPMGLFWSMDRLEKQEGAAKEQPTEKAVSFSGDVKPGESMSMEFRAEADGRPPAVTGIERYWATPNVMREPVSDQGLVGTLFYPAGAAPSPAILFPHGGYCLTPEKPAAVLASHGFAVLALKYCGEEGLPENTGSEIALEYFGTAITWLQDHPETDPGQLGVVGMSLGGTLALLLGSRFQEVDAAVSIKGSGVNIFNFIHNGEPVPSTRMQSTEIMRDALRARQPPECRPKNSDEEWSCYNWSLTHMMFILFHGLANPDALFPGVIPVERIKGPVMLVSGLDDQAWPSTLYTEVAYQRLKEHDFPYHFEHLAYPEAGHRLGIAHLPRTESNIAWRSAGGNARGAGVANADYWPRMIEFLRENLGNPKVKIPDG